MPQPPLNDDAALDTLMRLAAPLAHELREPFLHACTAELARYKADEIGPGTVFRTAKALQREFLVPPSGTKTPKYR